MAEDPLKADVMRALEAAPKPITLEQVRFIARGIFTPGHKKQAAEFEAWLVKNGAELVETLNG